jgi:hypothetical protein
MHEAKQSAFIWYHADAQLEEVLHVWVKQIGETLHIPTRLMVRHQVGKTTFMEVYEASGSNDLQNMIDGIERDVANQPWFAQLQSPRKAEIFVEVLAQETPSDS